MGPSVDDNKAGRTIFDTETNPQVIFSQDNLHHTIYADASNDR